MAITNVSKILLASTIALGTYTCYEAVGVVKALKETSKDVSTYIQSQREREAVQKEQLRLGFRTESGLEIKVEDVIGGPQKEIFINSNGTRYFFAIDGKKVEEYFKK